MASEPDLLTGVAAIAEHLGMTVRRIYYLHETKGLPTFTLGGGRVIHARRSTLAKHFAALEQEAR